MNILKKAGILKDVISCRYMGKRQPISAQLALTNRCPWRCGYCNVREKHKEEITTQQAIIIIKQLAENGNRRLHLVGGEPLLRQDLGAIVEAAKSLGLTVTIATTGYKIPQLWGAIKDIDVFFLSFDGPAQIHNMQRGKGSFEMLREGMAFLKNKNKKFWTTTVITRQNAGQLDFVLETAKKEKFITNFHLLYFSDYFRDHNNSIHPADIKKELLPVDTDYRQALSYLIKRKRSDMKDHIGSSELYFKSLLAWKDFSRVYRKESSGYYDCMAGRMFCYIDANGDIYPCCDVMGIVEPRNILKEGFRGAFFSLPKAPCKSCLVACYLELNLMFSLRMSSILNWARRI